METAAQEIQRRLVDSGLTLDEADHLLGRLMIEEAFGFVKLMCIHFEDPERYKEIVKMYRN